MAKSKKGQRHYLFFEIIDEKISVNSRASAANVSRAATLFLDQPASINRKNRRLSFASLRQIFTRMRKSFLLRASSTSIQLVATEPDARTDCRTSSVLLTVRGNCLTNVRTDRANSNVRILQIAWFSAILHFGTWDLILYLGPGAWDLELASSGSSSCVGPNSIREGRAV
jgi:hypothetical protein